MAAQTVAAGSQIEVGQPETPLPEPVELALRDVVQARDEIAFAYVPVIAFPDQPPSQVLVLFVMGEPDLETLLASVSAAVKDAIDAVICAHPKLKVEPLAVLPISLAMPLDALAQAVLITDTALHVTDVQAWHAAKNPKGPLGRLIAWVLGR